MSDKLKETGRNDLNANNITLADTVLYDLSNKSKLMFIGVVWLIRSRSQNIVT